MSASHVLAHVPATDHEVSPACVPSRAISHTRNQNLSLAHSAVANHKLKHETHVLVLRNPSLGLVPAPARHRRATLRYTKRRTVCKRSGTTAPTRTHRIARPMLPFLPLLLRARPRNGGRPLARQSTGGATTDRSSASAATRAPDAASVDAVAPLGGNFLLKDHDSSHSCGNENDRRLQNHCIITSMHEVIAQDFSRIQTLPSNIMSFASKIDACK